VKAYTLTTSSEKGLLSAQERTSTENPSALKSLTLTLRNRMLEKVSEGLAINFPWCPDMIQAYKFGLCVLCEKEKQQDDKFDNSSCHHCRKLTKMMCWSKGFGKTNER
jgi:hypothetical protein